VALTAGKIDGYFGDLFTPIVLKAGKVDVKIVARNFTSGQGRRMFAVLGGPDSGLNIPVQLADVPVAVSANTIIEYVTTSLIYQAGVPVEKISMVDVKSIPIRYQMLMSGQVKAATLPEPLVTLAQTKGCRVLDDDSRSQLSSTVLVFTGKNIRNRSRDITAFLAGISNAVEIINSGHPDIRSIMNRNCRVPESLKDTYPLPKFPELTLPDSEGVKAAVSWLSAKGTIKTAPKYSQLVDSRFLE
jgi:NitT/TauT family transport system substrate-binding protein